MTFYQCLYLQFDRVKEFSFSKSRKLPTSKKQEVENVEPVTHRSKTPPPVNYVSKTFDF